MGLRLNPLQGGDESRGGFTDWTNLSSPGNSSSKTSTSSGGRAEDSLVQSKRDRGKLRPYVRSNKPKLKWTSNLHKRFMQAVDILGGQKRATPKRILQLMGVEGLTIAHVKSHLQMYRSGKINADGVSRTDFKYCRGGQIHSKITQMEEGLMYDLLKPKSQLQELAAAWERLKKEHEAPLAPALALILLKAGRGSDAEAATAALLKDCTDNQTLEQNIQKKSEATMQLVLKDPDQNGGREDSCHLRSLDQLEQRDLKSCKFVPMEQLEYSIYRDSINVDQKHSNPVWGQTSSDGVASISKTYNSWPLAETSSTLYSDSRETKTGEGIPFEHIKLDLTMATGVPQEGINLLCPSSTEEVTLDLALA